MNVEKRKYKIKGFRDDGSKIRVLLEPLEIVKVSKKIGMNEILSDPMGIAQNLMDQQMKNIIHDSFSISREEYEQNKYLVGEIVIVSMRREKL